MSNVKVSVGVAMVLFGLLEMLVVFAFMSMIDPQLKGRAWWSEMLGKSWNNGEAMGTTVLGVTFVVFGVVICRGAVKPKKYD